MRKLVGVVGVAEWLNVTPGAVRNWISAYENSICYPMPVADAVLMPGNKSLWLSGREAEWLAWYSGRRQRRSAAQVTRQLPPPMNL